MTPEPVVIVLGPPMETTYRGEPRPIVPLVGEDGNAFSILGRVDRALRSAGCSQAHREAYRREAMSGDYDHLLAVTLRYTRGAIPGDDEA